MASKSEQFVVKRPFTQVTIAKHLRKTFDLCGPDVRRRISNGTILDVGFGQLARSTHALSAIFPEATIHAIDNDVLLANSTTAKSPPQKRGNVSYLFGDAELWLPDAKYDLVVICLAAHAFHHPMRAISNLVRSSLKPDGYLLFIHRTDAIMRATARVGGEMDKSEEVNLIRNAWNEIVTVSKEFELPWQARYVCEHDDIARCCKHLSLQSALSFEDEYPREVDTEKLLDVFGTVECPPQYQAPRSAWEDFLKQHPGCWPHTSKSCLQSKIRLSSFLYCSDGVSRGNGHKFPLPHATTTSRFFHLSLRPELRPDDRAFVQSLMSNLHEPVQEAIRDFYYITGNDMPLSLLGTIRADAGMPSNMPVNALTRALEKSDKVWDHSRTNHEFLLFIFPALERLASLSKDYRVPDPAHAIFGWRAQDTYVIPLLDDESAIRERLKVANFAPAEIHNTAAYLKARGGFARKHGCAAIYYVIFRSRVIDERGNFQAISFLTKRWLAAEEVRAVANAAYALLLAMEEQRMVRSILAIEEKEKTSQARHSDLQTNVTELQSQIAFLQSLPGIIKMLGDTTVAQSDSALHGAYDRLKEAASKLGARIIVAALRLKGSRRDAFTHIHQMGAQKNKSQVVGDFFTKVAFDKISREPNNIKLAVREIIKNAGENPDSPEFHTLLKISESDAARIDGKNVAVPSAPSPKNKPSASKFDPSPEVMEHLKRQSRNKF